MQRAACSVQRNGCQVGAGWHRWPMRRRFGRHPSAGLLTRGHSELSAAVDALFLPSGPCSAVQCSAVRTLKSRSWLMRRRPASVSPLEDLSAVRSCSSVIEPCDGPAPKTGPDSLHRPLSSRLCRRGRGGPLYSQLGTVLGGSGLVLRVRDATLNASPHSVRAPAYAEHEQSSKGRASSSYLGPVRVHKASRRG
jgi:hypothetical protein